MVALVTYYKQEDGSLKPVRLAQGTSTLVSSWQYSKCEWVYESEFNNDETIDAFDTAFRYASGDVIVKFLIDFKKTTAFYDEKLLIPYGDVSRSLEANNCRSN